MSMVDYVIVTEPDSTDLRNSPLFSQSTRIFRTLKKMEASPGVGTGPVRKIALGLLDRFDCNWTSESIVDNVLAINREQSLMPEQVVRDAFAAEP